MVKAEVKTPNKRKSIVSETPSKKIKVENGKANGKSPIVKKENESPKINLQIQKSNKKNKQQNKGNSDSQSPKGVKPFKGTKQVFQAGEKPKKGAKQQIKQNETKDQSQTTKKRRKAQFHSLIAEVQSKQGSKDPELLKKLNERIKAITSREELSKTAKKKLTLFNKLKLVCEEGSQAASAAAKSKAKETKKTAPANIKTEKKVSAPQAAQQKKKQAGPAKKEIKEEDDSDAEEEDSDAEESGEEEEDSDEEAEGEEDDDEEDDDDEDEDEDDDSDEEEAPAPKGKLAIKNETKTEKKASKSKDVGQQEPNKKRLNLDDLKNREIIKKGQKRFVLFIGNIPYDTTKQDLAEHFSKIGEIIDIRIPTDKGSNKPRGFGYIEVTDETAYEKCLSMHHSQLKGRRINVLYTQGGKKKGDDMKKQIKAKNMKLHALRKQGKLAGSVKQTQKRSFRRNKQKNSNQKAEES